MKLLKRLASMMLSLLMVLLMMPTSALAAEINPATTTGKLTITKEGSESTFAVYKLFDMSVATGADAFTYAANSNFTGFFSANPTLTAKVISGYNAEALNTFTANLQSYISTHNTPKTATEKAALQSGTTYAATFNNLTLGYYLVVETASTGAKVASKNFLVSVPTGKVVGSGTTAVTTWDYDVKAACKDTTVTFDKTIVKDGHDVDTATQKIGDTVNYRLDADVPKYDHSATDIKFDMTDTMSKGLTFDNNITVHSVDSSGKTSTNAIDSDCYKVTSAPSTNASMPGGTTIAIKFDYSKIESFSKIKVFYTATLNQDAAIGSAGNPNEAYLTYTNNPDTKSTHDTDKPKTIVYTTGIAINKNDADTRQDIAGAVFELKNSAGNVLAVYTYDINGNPRGKASDAGLSVATDASGMTYFLGLDAGTYTITETTAPAGYSLLPNPVTILITATKNGDKYTGEFKYQIDTEIGTTKTNTASITKNGDILIDVQISDDKGFTLPGTGGMGTTIFTVSGIAIILLGGCMALVYNKKKKKSEQH